MISIQCLAVKRISVHYFCPHSSMQRDPWQAARDMWPSPLIPRTNDATAVMSQIAFSKIPSFQNMMNVSTILGLDTKLNRDSLYDDLVETKSVFESITSQSTASFFCHSKMAAILHSVHGQCSDGCRHRRRNRVGRGTRPTQILWRVGPQCIRPTRILGLYFRLSRLLILYFTGGLNVCKCFQQVSAP